jgi:ABC-type antimicrobial peptide transport system permease subunit
VNLLATDTAFLQILDYSVIAGERNIRRPEDVFLTETFAAKIFGKEDPLGKTLSYSTINKTVTVAGIIRTPTYKSILSFDMLVASELNSGWDRTPQSLILLYPGVNYHDVNSRYSEFTDMKIWGCGVRYMLFPWKDVYLNKHIDDYGTFAHGNIVYVYILAGIGILLLLIGLVNYINIHSTVMMRRGREFGLKKVFGAEGYKIFAQLFVENLLLILVSLGIGFWLATALGTFVENAFDIRQYSNFRFDICLALVLTVTLPVAVSVAPYLRYQYFSPLRSLRTVNASSKSLFSRKFFLCFQYFITTGLIVVSLFFIKQLNFMFDFREKIRIEGLTDNGIPFAVKLK